MTAMQVSYQKSLLTTARFLIQVIGAITIHDSIFNILCSPSRHRPLHDNTGTSLDDIQVQDGSTLDLEDSADVCYSVWVSFAEVYNEFIYDLLGEESKTRSHRSSSLKLAEDTNHNHFIKGKLTSPLSLLTIHVYIYIHVLIRSTGGERR